MTVAIRKTSDAGAIATAVNRLVSQSQNTGSITLGTGTQTLLRDARVWSGAVVLLAPRSASSAALKVWVEPGSGQLTVHHAAGSEGCQFSFVLFGI